MEPELEQWLSEHPREENALQHLPERSEIWDRIAAWVLRGGDDVPFELPALTNACDTWECAKEAGTSQEPPRFGLRRPVRATVLKLDPVKEDGVLEFRVEFETVDGWSGYFKTRNTKVLKEIKNARGPVTLVGEVVTRITRFYVHFGGKIAVTR